MKDSEGGKKPGVFGKLGATLRGKKGADKAADEVEISGPPVAAKAVNSANTENTAKAPTVMVKSLSNPAAWDALWDKLGKIPTENTQQKFLEAIISVFGEDFKVKDALLDRLMRAHKVYGSEVDFEKYKSNMKALADNLAILDHTLESLVEKGFKEKLERAETPVWMKQSEALVKHPVAREFMRHLSKIDSAMEKYNQSKDILYTDIERLQMFYEIIERDDLVQDLVALTLAGEFLGKLFGVFEKRDEDKQSFRNLKDADKAFLNELGKENNNLKMFMQLLSRVKPVQIFSEGAASLETLSKAATKADDPRREELEQLKKQCEGILDRFDSYAAILAFVNPVFAAQKSSADPLYASIHVFMSRKQEGRDASLAKDIYQRLTKLIGALQVDMLVNLPKLNASDKAEAITSAQLLGLFQKPHAVISVLSYFAQEVDPGKVNQKTIIILVDLLADIAKKVQVANTNDDANLNQIIIKAKSLIEVLGRRYADFPEIHTAVEKALGKSQVLKPLEESALSKGDSSPDMDTQSDDDSGPDADALSQVLRTLRDVLGDAKKADANIEQMQQVSQKKAPSRPVPGPPPGRPPGPPLDDAQKKPSEQPTRTGRPLPPGPGVHK